MFLGRKGINMENTNIWGILEIEETKDEALIKNAYRTILMKTNPEDDPEGFKRLREAYEQAVSLCHASEQEESIDEDDIDRWIHNAERIYSNWSLRIDLREWKEFLSDDICLALDTSDEASEKFMVFLMSHYNLPDEVWTEIDKTFDYLNLKSEIREKFPDNFYTYLCNQINYNSFINYNEFEGQDDAQYDKAIDTYYAIKRTIDNSSFEECNIEELIEELDSYNIYYPYFEVEKMRYELTKKEPDRDKILDYVDKLSKYDDNFYILCYLGEAYLFLGNIDAAKDYITKSREINSNFINGEIVYIKYLMAAQLYKEAKESSTDFLDKYGNSQEGLYYMHESNKHLMADLREKADSGDIDSFMELGWCLFQNEEFEECINMLKTYEPDEEHEFDYNNLRGRCTLASGDYKSALPFLEKWLTDIIILEDDGTEKYQKKYRRLGYANYTVGMSNFSISVELKKAGNVEESLKYINLSLKYLEEAIKTEHEEKEIVYYRERKAYVLIQLGENEKAIDVCDEIINEYPEYYPAFCDRQLAFYNLRNGQGVIDNFYGAIEIYAGNAEPYVLAIKAFIGYSQYDDAMKIVNMSKENHIESDDIELQRIIIGIRNNTDNKMSTLTKLLEDIVRLKNSITDTTDIEDIYEIDFNMGIIFENMKQLDEAAKCVSNAYSNSNNQRFLWCLAELYERNAKLVDAYNTYEKIEKVYGSSAEVCYRMGRCLSKRSAESYKQLAMFMKAYELDNNHPAACDYISDIYHDRYIESGDLQDYELSMKFADKQIENNSNAYVLINRGLLKLDGGQLEEALQDFMKAIEYDSTDIYGYNNAGYTYKRMKLYDKAIEMYEKGLKAESEQPKNIIYKNMFITYLCMNDFDNAKLYLCKCLELDKDANRNAVLIQRLYHKMNEFEESVNRKMNYTASADDRVQVYISIAEDYMILGDKKTAFRFCKFARNEAKRDDQYADVFVLYGDYFDFMENNKKKALSMYRKAYGYCPSLEIALKICELSAKMGDKKSAKIYFEKSENLIRDKWKSIDNFLGYARYKPIHLFQMGKLYFYSENIDKAKECFDKMQECNACSHCDYNKCYEALLGKALIAAYENDKASAIELLEEASQIDPSDMESRIELKELRK